MLFTVSLCLPQHLSGSVPSMCPGRAHRWLSKGVGSHDPREGRGFESKELRTGSLGVDTEKDRYLDLAGKV